jgi:hypothetical protein
MDLVEKSSATLLICILHHFFDFSIGKEPITKSNNAEVGVTTWLVTTD